MPNNALLCLWVDYYSFWDQTTGYIYPMGITGNAMPYALSLWGWRCLGLGTRPQTVAQETELPKLLKRWPVPVWSVRECCFPADDSGGSHILTLQWLMWFV